MGVEYIKFNIKTISWNCNGFKSSVYDINQLCERYDIIFIQEHWLRDDELTMIKTVHPDFTGFGISAMDTSNGLLLGRPYGGVCILWRKSMAKYINVVQYDDKRLLGCKLCINNDTMLFINVYLPYQCDENYDDFVRYLGKLSAHIEMSTTASVVLVGDFNSKMYSTFETELLDFVKRNNLYLSDYEHLGKNNSNFTYVSDAHSTTSWLDHYVCSFSAHNEITLMQILDKLPSSDHLPLAAVFQHDDTIHVDTDDTDVDDQADNTCNWHKATTDDCARYEHITRTHLNGVHIPTSALTCTDSTCSDVSHRQSLHSMYNEVRDVLYRSGISSVPINSRSSGTSQFVIPGWNDYVREAHTEARYAYVTWRDFGKPRHGPVSDLMKTTRLRFKYALRQCQAKEETARADALAKSLVNKDTVSFWKSVKRMNNKTVPQANSVNGVVGSTNICDMWKEHYGVVLNSVTNTNNRDSVLATLNTISQTDRHVVTPSDIAAAIADLKRGKAIGHDLLAAEHYIYAHPILTILLALLFTAFIVHGYLPDGIMKTIIVPLVKHKTGNMQDKNNYRPIALVTAASKVLEIVILNHIELYIDTSHNQFGFKRKHSTDICVFALKNVIQFYKQHNSPVFTCFLDASRAFDRVNHWSLFKKLVERGVPLLIVRLLSYWYNVQTFYVKWGNSTSTCFTTTNGVRQGGILSPRLFTLYIDDLSNLLHNLNIGCFVGFTCVNHLFYADDICLLAPSAMGLQQLINVCEQYGSEHDILYNPIKSKCMAVLPNRYKLTVPTVTLNNIDLEYADNIKYLGVVLQNNLKDEADIVRQLHSLYASSNTLLSKFSRCSIPVKQTLVESYCLNFYCATLWCEYSKKSFSKIRVAYNNIFRNILGYCRRDSASSMFVTNRIDSLEARIRKSCFKFRERLVASNNTIILTLNDNTWVRSNYIWRKWTNIMYYGAYKL